ncbi:hypothetical protein I5F15_10955 [Bacillus velezensis]|uniref:hypothetical protein n=1 Tax=Bacillus velezensis TaxID=492670 RepID=UPI00192A7843|nr:hypothetical protein [Bacillus velezensis]MBL4957344.1 hypothetical protein [Bacillus velezensis]
MAKLDGVKTLGMVNGEITKVAYGGAAYERVEGRAKDFGSVGDLVLNGRIHCDLTVGAFYEIVINEEYGWTTVRDDVGDWHSDVLYNPRSVLFRKVSANTDTSSSLEERVSSAEGEIESLKSDVAALKGEAEYKRIDADEAKVGDFVKFDDPPDYLTNEEYYEIVRFDSYGDPLVIDDDYDEYDASNRDFEIYRKVSATSVEAERLKVGDYAKVVNATDYHRFTDGDIVEIIGDRFGSPYNELARRITDGKNQYVPKRELVRATVEEVAEAKDEAARAKFKEGAKVRLLSGAGDYPLNGFENGKIYEVSDNSVVCVEGRRIRLEGGNCLGGFGYATPDQLEILTEEEAAEIERQQAEEAKWAKIGRKVGEYKKGDIARVVDNKCAGRVANGDIIEVLKQASGGSVVDTVHGYFLKVELITPVEARFDR